MSEANSRELFNVTNILVTIAIAANGVIWWSLNGIDSKLFTHLTNHEIHTPSSIVVSKAEFLLYQNMRDKQMQDVKDMVSEIRTDLKNAIKK
jgi:hypothetical protein